MAPVNTSQYTYGVWMTKNAAVSSDGTIYIQNTTYNEIEKRDSAGNWKAITTPGLDLGSFAMPSGLTLRAGKLYVSDSFNNRIQVRDAFGN